MWDILRDSTYGRIVTFLAISKSPNFPGDTSHFNVSKNGEEADSEQSGNAKHISNEIKDIESAGTGYGHSTSLVNGNRVVGWYGEDDQENPQNWSNTKRYWVGALICTYTFSVYVGSAIYVPSEAGVMKEFEVGQAAASLGLALYVLAYGLGTLLFSPLSEIPTIGRTTPYITTFTLFIILLIPASLVQNLAGLLVLRFLLGFFASPALATAGASFQDIFPGSSMPYIIAVWSAVATCGPSIGPVLSSFSTLKEGWYWSHWELLWLSGPVFILMFFFLPETSSETILLRRARRLRKVTGHANLKPQSEIDQANLSVKQIAFDALIKPWEINIQDPAVLFTTIYTGLVYGILYTYFEAFPLVYQGVYGFSPGILGLGFLAFFAAQLIYVPLYILQRRCIFERQLNLHGMGPIEEFLSGARFTSFLLPIGLFIFAFIRRQNIPWVVSLIGVGLSSAGIFFINLSMFTYVPFCYPRYAASLLAANSLSRSLLAAAAIMFAPPMFKRLGVEGGVGLLAGLTVLCCGGLWFLYYFGASLRARSKFAVRS